MTPFAFGCKGDRNVHEVHDMCGLSCHDASLAKIAVEG